MRPTLAFCVTKLSGPHGKHLYLFIFKCLIGLLPPYITSVLDWTTGHYKTGSTNFFRFQVPLVYSELVKSAFRFCAPNP